MEVFVLLGVIVGGRAVPLDRYQTEDQGVQIAQPNQ